MLYLRRCQHSGLYRNEEKISKEKKFHLFSIGLKRYFRVVLMAEWSKALPLTASCFSLLPGFESWHGHLRHLSATWGKAVVCAGYSDFLYHLNLASHELASMWQKK